MSDDWKDDIMRETYGPASDANNDAALRQHDPATLLKRLEIAANGVAELDGSASRGFVETIWEAQAEITRLRSSLTTAREDALEEAANVAKKRQTSHGDCDYLSPMDPETGAFECSKRGDCLCQERVEEAETIELAIRALQHKETEDEG